MNQFVEKALFDLTGKENIDLVSVEELQQIVNEHPYFAIGHLLLAKKLKLSQPEAFPLQAQKTVLYYSNPYLLHYYLTDEIQELHFTNVADETVTPVTDEVEEDTARLEVAQDGSIRLTNEQIAAGGAVGTETFHGDATKEDLSEHQPAEAGKKVLEARIDDGEVFKSNLEKSEDICELEIENFSERETINEIFTDDNNNTSSEPSPIINSTAESEAATQPQQIEENTDLGIGESIKANKESAELNLEEPAVDTNTDHNSVAPESNILTPEEVLTLNAPEPEAVSPDDGSTTLAHEGTLTPHALTDSNIPTTIDQPGDFHLTPEEVSTIEDGQPSVNVVDAKDGSLDKLDLNEVEEVQPDALEPKETMEPLQEQVQSEEVSPDPFHPEQEEILEEIEQEKVDKEVEKEESIPASEQLHETQEITLPVHEEDAQIIDEFVEAAHHHTAAEAVIEGDKNTTALPVIEATKPEEPLIPIEPYYTVDYFASQGIRFTPEKDPQDKLGKQLKSFTQWLKHMKKIGPEDAVKPNEEAHVDSRIQGIADISNTKREIVTEAMADVLEKQGKTDQAIEVYQKLSFLNPDKSSYFADKIQKLKGS